MDFADSSAVSGRQAVAVETCECPYGYSGTSCEVSTRFHVLCVTSMSPCVLCVTLCTVCVVVSPGVLQSGRSLVRRELHAVRV